VLEADGGDLDVDRRAVGAQELLFDQRHLAPPLQDVEAAAHRAPEVGMDQLHDVAPHQLLGAADADQLRRGRVDESQLVVHVDEDRVGAELDHVPVALLALPQQLFRPAPLGDVLRDDQPRAAARQRDLERGDLGLDPRAVLALMRHAHLLDRRGEELLPRPAVVRHRRVVHGRELQRLLVVHPHRQRIRGEQRAVTALALAQRLLGFLPAGVVAGHVHRGDRRPLVIADERRRGQDVDQRAVVRDPHHLLLEHAGRGEELPRAGLLAAADDVADVPSDQRLRLVAEHRAEGAVHHAYAPFHVDDEHRPLHCFEQLARGEFGREVDEAEAPHRAGGDDHERQHRHVADRIHVHAERRQRVDEGHRAEAEREEDRTGALAGGALGALVHPPEQAHGQDEDLRLQRDPGEVVQRTVGVPPPRVAGDRRREERRRGAGQRDDAAAEPEERGPAAQAFLPSGEDGREMKDRGGDEDAEEQRGARPDQRDRRGGGGEHQRGGAEPAGGAGGDGEEEDGDVRGARAEENGDAEDEDDGGGDRGRARQSARRVATPRQ
jgi:hypothetical protein